MTATSSDNRAWNDKLEAMMKAAIVLDTYVHTLSNAKLDTYVHGLLDTMTSVLDSLTKDLFQFEVDLKTRDGAIMTLTAELEAAKQQVTILGLLLTMSGGGIDPNGFYAGTPGQWAQAVLEVARRAQVWHASPEIEYEDALGNAVERLNMAEAAKESSNG